MQKKRVVYKQTKVMDFFAREGRLQFICRVRRPEVAGGCRGVRCNDG